MPNHLLLMLLCALSCLSSPDSLAATDVDPRPQILIIGEMSSTPIRGVTPWYGVLTSQHPEWALNVRSKDTMVANQDRETPGKKKPKVWPGAVAQLPSLIDGLQPQNLVIVMLGRNYYRQELRTQADSAQSAADLTALLQALKEHPVTQQALIAVVTPLPVVEAKLDQWSQTSFAEAGTYSAEVAQAWSAAATTAGATIIPAHSWIMQQGTGGDAVMTAGWMVRWDGIGRLGAWMSEQVASLKPKASNVEAFAAWQREFAAHQQLDAILVATGGGQPAAGPALTLAPAKVQAEATTESAHANDGKKKKKKKKQKGPPPVRLTVPVSALAQGQLDVVIRADGPHLAAIGSGSEKAWDCPQLELTLADGTVKLIPHQGLDWQQIDSVTPDAAVPDTRFGLSIGKWRPFPVLDGREASRREVLMRWRLGTIAASTVTEATLVVPLNSRKAYLQEVIDGKAQEMKTPGPYGGFSAHVLAAPDNQWHAEQATWNSRDGTTAWSGGEINKAERAMQIASLLTKADLPTPVRERAEALRNQE